MSKRLLTSEERSQIISLRGVGAGWAEIERRTGVARRTALRVFGEWQASKTADNQREARRQIAAQEFERHMRDLISLAERLVSALGLPAPTDVASGDDVVTRVVDMEPGLPSEGQPDRLSAIDAERVRRRNRLLFRALREHTSAGVDWRAYDRWLKARNEWAELRGKLVNRVAAVLRNVVADQLGAGACTAFDEAVAVRWAEYLTRSILLALSTDSLACVADYVQVEASGGTAYLTFGCGRELVQERLVSSSDATGFAACCARALETVVRGRDAGIVDDLARHREAMSTAHEALVDALQELRLVPLILATKCQFCPA